MKPAKIFIAVKTEALPFVTDALKSYDLLVARNLTHGLEIGLEQDIDLFLIGILFDDSNAMELIKAVRLSSKHRNTKILAVRLMPSQHTNLLRQVMDTMKALHTVSDYLELEIDDPEAKEKILSAVELYLPVRKRLGKG